MIQMPFLSADNAGGPLQCKLHSYSLPHNNDYAFCAIRTAAIRDDQKSLAYLYTFHKTYQVPPTHAHEYSLGMQVPDSQAMTCLGPEVDYNLPP